MNKKYTQLSTVDVSNYIEKIGKLTYLSWAGAWDKLMKNCTNARFNFTDHRGPNGNLTDILTYEDGTCSVECTVTVDEESHTMWLPVMDYNHKAIQNPNARQISDAKMRCLAKCIALHGLGMNLYLGEDLPQPPTQLNGTLPVATLPTNEPKPEAPISTNGVIDNGDSDYVHTTVLAGWSKGKGTYIEQYEDNLDKINKDLGYWNSRTTLNETGKEHCRILNEYAKVLNSRLSKEGLSVS